MLGLYVEQIEVPASNATTMRPPLPLNVFPHRIETARLVLRSPERENRALYARQAWEACMQSQALSEDAAGSFADFMIGHWERYGFGFLVMHALDGSGNPLPIGHVGFKYVDARPTHWAEHYEAIELGYSQIPSSRGHGYATEGARAALAAAFEAFDVASIHAKCRHENSKSAAVLLRCGMQEVDSSDAMRRFYIGRPA
jgi:RimJ/RimL family protein N-acetyltransferase